MLSSADTCIGLFFLSHPNIEQALSLRVAEINSLRSICKTLRLPAERKLTAYRFQQFFVPCMTAPRRHRLHILL
jgi:hypothetical protein